MIDSDRQAKKKKRGGGDVYVGCVCVSVTQLTLFYTTRLWKVGGGVEAIL